MLAGMASSITDWRPITDGVFTCVCEPESVTCGLVVGEGAVLLIDTGSTPEQGAALAESAVELTGRPVTHVAVTHCHFDHWGGLAAFASCQTYGHENLLSELAAKDSIPNDPAPPTNSFSLAKAIDLGSIRVELVHFGPAHTNNDVIVFVPDRNVIFVGDLLESAGDPQFGPSTRLANWPMVLDGVLGASNDETIFVPGHGPSVDQQFALKQRAELAMVYGTAEQLIGQGTALDQAYAAAEWPFGQETMATALQVSYQELAEKGVVPRSSSPSVLARP